MGEADKVKGRKYRRREKERHPTVEKKPSSQQLLKHFVLLLCHLTRLQQQANGSKIGHSNTERYSHSQYVPPPEESTEESWNK